MSALVHSRAGPEALAATLSALVTGVAEGVVADAVVIVEQESEAIDLIIEATGAHHVVIAAGSDPWSAGAALARRDWFMCLEAGDIPLEGWIGAVDRFAFIAEREGYPIGRLARRAPDWREWLRERVGRLSREVRAGDIVHRSRLGGAHAKRLRIAGVEAQILRQPQPDRDFAAAG
ncbi:hypothetical protein [Saliniramus sp.]|uniref:hypothetical protein n=1 Tax=Saliniramus sp. TaxID=2986772 RepID=UPI002C23E740|nr:hypothetical protein [Saliniramus sp.]HMB09542.1 hypothetical protein [Saliniramus sp.]